MRANRPSHTAKKIAMNLVFAEGVPEIKPLLPEGLAKMTEELMVRGGAMKSWEASLVHRPWFQKLTEVLERRLAPGLILHLALRKRWYEDEVRRAIAGGVSQVLNVGAGYDILCLRLAAEVPDVTFVEVDHPATQAVKRRGLEALGPMPKNLHLVAVDLGSTSLESALSRVGGWKKDARSVVLAEGLLMYLKEASVTAFLEAVRANTGKGSLLLATCIRSDEYENLGVLSRLTSFSLKLIGEPWYWTMPEKDIGGFFEERSYRRVTDPSRVDFRKRYLEPAGLTAMTLSEIELAVIAEPR